MNKERFFLGLHNIMINLFGLFTIAFWFGAIGFFIVWGHTVQSFIIFMVFVYAMLNLRKWLEENL